MNLKVFKADPWKHSHAAYQKKAFFRHDPATEYATGEVFLSSAYRALGLQGWPEQGVSSEGTTFVQRTQKPKVHDGFGSTLKIEEWQTLIGTILESPKQSNQSSRRFLQMTPLVPDIALYSGSPRLSGNPWTPGNLLRRMIVMGCDSPEDASELWTRFASALSIGEDDDIWARWIDDEFSKRRENRPAWKPEPLALPLELPDLPSCDKVGIEFPARRFCADLPVLLSAKGHLTRRQWISLVESLLRIAAVSHVLWICELHARIWSQAKAILDGAPVPEETGIRGLLLDNATSRIKYGAPVMPTMRNTVSRYLVARVGINACLWALEDQGCHTDSLSSCSDIHIFLGRIAQSRSKIPGVQDTIQSILDEHARLIQCRKNIGSNVMEFCRYMLGQRQPALESLRGYDQGYFVRKAGTPFVLSMGPVAVLAMVHCSLGGAHSPRSVKALLTHLSKYGIDIGLGEIMGGELGVKLRTLGLVLDSPDAESGMLLVPPFR